MKSSPNVSTVVVNVSKRPIYKVIRIGAKELMIAFKKSRFLDALSFKDIRDELVYEIQPSRKSNGVICISIKLNTGIAKVHQRFDSKNFNLTIELEKKINLQDQKRVSAQKSIENSREYLGSQQSLHYIQEKTTEDIYVPTDTAFLSQLLTVVDNDGKPDTKLFLDAVNACIDDRLAEGFKIISQFIIQCPESRFIEKAFFLLAECYRRLYSDNLSEHFQNIVENYQNAIQKFPHSVYTPVAILVLAGTYFKMKDYYKALAYYNILCSQHRDKSELASEARFQIGRIYLVINKPTEAISAFNSVAELYPQTFFAKMSKMEIAKAYFELNSFKKSLSLWTNIAEINPVSIYKYPDILMYIGNNYYQLGHYRNARDTLLRGINLHPDCESNHLILARIADAYYELDEKESAYKFYNLVIKEYPESDGALISSIRLASRYKKTDKQKIVLIPPVGVDISDYYLYSNPIELYEDIIKRHSDNPISKFVMLKLALLQQKEEEYEASINTVRAILQKYPQTELGKDILQDSYEAFFKQELEKQNYEDILSYYERDKDILVTCDSPAIFLIVGETYRRLRLHHSASLMFQMADKFFLEENRPPRLLFGLGESFFRMSDLKNAYRLLTDFVQKDASHKDVPFAYYRIGQILLKEKKYDEAKKNLKIALYSNQKELPKSDIIMGIAKALKGEGQYEEAITWAKRAVDLLAKQKSCEDLYDVYIELGGLYEKIGDNCNVACTLETALKLHGKDDETKRYGLVFRLAECYLRLNKVEDALGLLQRISTYRDTLWGSMAAEKIKEIDIREKITKFNKLKS